MCQDFTQNWDYNLKIRLILGLEIIMSIYVHRPSSYILKLQNQVFTEDTSAQFINKSFRILLAYELMALINNKYHPIEEHIASVAKNLSEDSSDNYENYKAKLEAKYNDLMLISEGLSSQDGASPIYDHEEFRNLMTSIFMYFEPFKTFIDMDDFLNVFSDAVDELFEDTHGGKDKLIENVVVGDFIRGFVAEFAESAIEFCDVKEVISFKGQREGTFIINSTYNSLVPN